MKEIQDIVAAFEQIKHQRAALATVVQTAGSVYRRAGARMLIRESGQRIGSISGGCLETDVCDRAQAVMASGEPVVAVYDTIANQDLLWGLGLGCNGLVKILIEPLQATKHSPLTFIADCMQQRQFGVLATIFQTDGLLATPIASHLMLNAAGEVKHNLQDALLIEKIIADAQTTLHLQQSSLQQSSLQRSSTKQYEFPTGKAAVWLELIQPPLPLIIFGAGQDAIPVAQFAKALGWHITIVDRRAVNATPDRFPMADRIIITHPEQGLNDFVFDSRTAAVIMTHHYFDDRELLKLLLPSAIGYLGLLGPKRRTKQLLEDLQTEGLAFSPHSFHFHTPVGLDIGAETPEAIALAIVAEIQAVFANRTGGMLRDRKAPLHVHNADQVC